MKTLSGHVSEETAYVVDDYPYGFRLRCKIRYWIETTKSGQRFCSQTTNPKRAGEVWNKPKKSTYSDFCVLYLNEDNHVRHDCFKIEYGSAEKFAEFLKNFEHVLTSEYEKNRIIYGKTIFKARENMHRLSLEHCESGNIYDVPADKRSSVIFQSTKMAADELGVDLKDVLLAFPR